MKMLTRKIAILSTLLLLPLLAGAAPSLINYQGRLVDTTGNPLVGVQSIVFKIYTVPTAGAAIWSETQSVTPDNGIFSVSLGSVTPLPASTFLADTLYLGVAIGADPEMSPRTRLLSTPYSLYTANLGSSGSQATISTDTVISAAQLRLGNFVTLPGNIGEGAVVYDSVGKQVNFWNGTAWSALSSGGASPWSSASGLVYLGNNANNVGVGTATPLYKLDVAGGINAASSMTATAYYGDGSALGGLVHLASSENVGGVKTFTSSLTVTDAAGISADNLALAQNVAISSEASAALGAGVRVSSNIYVVGFSSAAKYYGDGSALTGIVTSDKLLKAGDTMTGTLTMNANPAFATSSQAAIVFSTHVYVSGSQLRLGNFGAGPAAIGAGSLYYDNGTQLLYYSNNGLSWNALAAGGASPWTSAGGKTTLVNAGDNVGINKVPVEKLDVAGNIKSDYGIIAATAAIGNSLVVGGWVNASSAALTGNFGVGGTITAGSGNNLITTAAGLLDSTKLTGNLPALDGSALTSLNASNLASGTVPLAQLSGITNTQIDPGAAIVDSKLATITTAGKVANSATTGTNLATANAIVMRDASGDFNANVINANLSGNAATATTAVSFSGALAGEVTGNQGTTVVSNAVSANTPSAIVRRDASGNFSAGAITATILTGTLTNAVPQALVNLSTVTSIFSMVATDTTTLAGVKISSGLNNGSILVGNAGNQAIPVAITGDVTMSNTGVTAIGATKVLDSMIAGVAASKLTGSISGSVVNFSTITTQFNSVFADTTTLASIKISSALASGSIFVGNATGVAAPAAMSGDVTLDNSGLATIGNLKVTDAKVLLTTGAITSGTWTDVMISAAANIGWTKISKTGSSLADLATRSAGDLTSGTLPDARLSGAYSSALTFGSAAGGPITFSTHVVLSASQLRLGNYAGNPATNAGAGALYYDTGDGLLHYSNGAAWTALAAGGASPWSGGGTGTVTLVAPGDKVSIVSTDPAALKVAGGITAGSGNVAIVDTTGKIPALSGTYFASLSGANLTGLNSSSLSGTVPAGLVDLSTVTASIAVKISSGLTNGSILVGNAGNQATPVAITGDVTMSNTGVTAIGATKVLDSMISGMAASKLTGAISGGVVDFSTITTAIGVKISSGLTNGSIFVGNVGNQATPVAMTGDVTMTNAGVTAIGATKVLDSMISGMSSSKLSGTVAQGLVNLSTVTTALAGKLDNLTTVPPALINLSTVTTALAGKLDNATTVPPALINLSTVTTALNLKADASAVLSNTATVPPALINLSTVTTALALKAADNVAVHLTGNENISGIKTFSDGIIAASATFSAAGGVTVASGITASSGTFTNTGDANYSIETSSGINIKAGPLVVAESTSTLAGNAIMVSFGGTPMMMQSGTGTLTSGTQTVTFNHIFRTGTTPVVVLTDTFSAAPMQASTPTNAGFIAEGSTTDTYNWIAIGVAP